MITSRRSSARQAPAVRRSGGRDRHHSERARSCGSGGLCGRWHLRATRTPASSCLRRSTALVHRTPSAADRSAAKTPERGRPYPASGWNGAGARRTAGSRPACAHPGTAIARRRPVPRSALFLRGRRAPLPAVCSVHRRRRPARTDRDAARLHAESGGLRRRDRNERPGRRAPAAHRLSGADRRRQLDVLLELVPARATRCATPASLRSSPA